jgi:hypothetical protein
MRQICLILKKIGFNVYNEYEILHINRKEFNSYKWKDEEKHFVRSWHHVGEDAVTYKDLLKFTSSKSKKLKIKNPELDPYGEEDWGYEIRENIKEEFIINIQDTIDNFFNGNVDAFVEVMNKTYINKNINYYKNGRSYGTFVVVEYTNHYDDYPVRLKMSNGQHGHPDEIGFFEPLNFEKGNWIKIERPDLDPYGEENWGFIKEMRIGRYTPKGHVIKEIDPIAVIREITLERIRRNTNTAEFIFKDLIKYLKKRLIGKVTSFSSLGKDSKGNPEVHGAGHWTIVNIYNKEEPGHIRFVGYGRLGDPKNTYDVRLYLKDKIYYEDFVSSSPEVDPYGEEDWDTNESKAPYHFTLPSHDNKYFLLLDELKVINKESPHFGQIAKINGHVDFYGKRWWSVQLESGIYTHFFSHEIEDLSKEDKEKREEIKNRMKDIDPYGEEKWSNVLEYVEFRKTKEYKLKGYYNEFEDYIEPFLERGEWYRIKCFRPKEKKDMKIIERPGKENKYKYFNKKKMQMYVIRFTKTHTEMGPWHYILYDKIYKNGEIVNENRYLSWDRLVEYKDVIFEHIESPELKKKEEELRQKMIHVDPYGEEEWISEEYREEPEDPKFEIGDIVELRGDVGMRSFKGEIGTITKKQEGAVHHRRGMKYPAYYAGDNEDCGYYGTVYYIDSVKYWVPPHVITKFDSIRRERRERKEQIKKILPEIQKPKIKWYSRGNFDQWDDVKEQIRMYSDDLRDRARKLGKQLKEQEKSRKLLQKGDICQIKNGTNYYKVLLDENGNMIGELEKRKEYINRDAEIVAIGADVKLRFDDGKMAWVDPRSIKKTSVRQRIEWYSKGHLKREEW